MRSPTTFPRRSALRRGKAALAALALGLPMLVGPQVHAACERRSSTQVGGLNNNDLQTAYCGARTLLDNEVAATKQALEANQPAAKANILACYDTVTNIIAALSARGIDVDAARERCDAGAHAGAPATAPVPAAATVSSRAAADKPVSAAKPAAAKPSKKKVPARKAARKKSAKPQ